MEDVRLMVNMRDPRGPDTTSSLQAARQALLSQTYDHQKYIDESNLTSVSEKARANYHNAQEISLENCARRLSSDWGTFCKGECGRESPKDTATARRFTHAGLLEHMEKVQAGKQYLLFRRLYSELEREQVRKKKLQSSHSRQVEALKKRKEMERRKIEEEMALDHTSSVVSTSLSEDKRMAEEWAELMLEEERKQQMQKAKETERYLTALKMRLREQVEMRKLVVPPLCSCAKTVWDANPNACANNCIFYRNPNGMCELNLWSKYCLFTFLFPFFFFMQQWQKLSQDYYSH